MPAPAYEYEEFDDAEEHEGNEEECDDGLLGQMGQYAQHDEEDEEGGEACSDEGEDEDAALQAIKSDATPDPMPTDFYNEFESFLTKPPPKFTAPADPNARPKKKKSGDDVALPRLGSGDKSGAPHGKSKSSVSSKIKSKVTASRAIEASGVGRTFDPALLQEAFAYADRLQHEVGDDDDGEPMTRGEDRKMPAKSGSAPQLSKPQKSNNGGSDRRLNPYERQQQMRKPSKKANSAKSGNQNKEGIVKRLRSKTSMEAPDGQAFSNISAKGLEHSRTKAGVDYAALVENFENGTTLHKLKAELAASRQSMAESENFMKKMSKEYTQKKRR